jgi:hypothetical protein
MMSFQILINPKNPPFPHNSIEQRKEKTHPRGAQKTFKTNIFLSPSREFSFASFSSNYVPIKVVK